MRQWTPSPPSATGRQATTGPAGHALAGMVHRLGEPGFASGLLQDLAPVLPAASWSVYRTGHRCKPTLFMSASLGVPDTTQDCWWAYLSGPYRHDRTWGRSFDEAAPAESPTRLCHLTAREVDGEHRARVYEAHGVAERVSVVEYESDGSVFAVNFYRHQHQKPFRDAHIGGFEAVAPVLLALARKHIALSHSDTLAPAAWPRSGSAGLALPQAEHPARHGPLPASLPALRERLLRVHADFTDRELDVCARLLQGMTHEGIASDLGLGVPTVKTYRNRAFARLGIHFRNELFARVLSG
ncbi:MAG: helix-turn-helix transcriptional regulator [Acidovorax sp.]|uniref:helix-turn-helix transcriptional regulator n=1 Tax=unclassified Acidovorax TaxID=2684926 RepID=UPI000F17B4A8|nr:helix-turn-helix transcriptional regulator [Acidovorax sp. 94]MBT9441158.1 helix-turn-helix transcriptional regulator [Acidovorax sp.]RKR66832.1 regulatory LuxR family protein [Acidovorax sp. 94]